MADKKIRVSMPSGAYDKTIYTDTVTMDIEVSDSEDFSSPTANTQTFTDAGTATNGLVDNITAVVTYTGYNGGPLYTRARLKLDPLDPASAPLPTNWTTASKFSENTDSVFYSFDVIETPIINVTTDSGTGTSDSMLLIHLSDFGMYIGEDTHKKTLVLIKHRDQIIYKQTYVYKDTGDERITIDGDIIKDLNYVEVYVKYIGEKTESDFGHLSVPLTEQSVIYNLRKSNTKEPYYFVMNKDIVKGGNQALDIDICEIGSKRSLLRAENVTSLSPKIWNNAINPVHIKNVLVRSRIHGSGSRFVDEIVLDTPDRYGSYTVAIESLRYAWKLTKTVTAGVVDKIDIAISTGNDPTTAEITLTEQEDDVILIPNYEISGMPKVEFHTKISNTTTWNNHGLAHGVGQYGEFTLTNNTVASSGEFKFTKTVTRGVNAKIDINICKRNDQQRIVLQSITGVSGTSIKFDNYIPSGETGPFIVEAMLHLETSDFLPGLSNVDDMNLLRFRTKIDSLNTPGTNHGFSMSIDTTYANNGIYRITNTDTVKAPIIDIVAYKTGTEEILFTKTDCREKIIDVVNFKIPAGTDVTYSGRIRPIDNKIKVHRAQTSSNVSSIRQAEFLDVRYTTSGSNFNFTIENYNSSIHDNMEIRFWFYNDAGELILRSGVHTIISSSITETNQYIYAGTSVSVFYSYGDLLPLEIKLDAGRATIGSMADVYVTNSRYFNYTGTSHSQQLSTWATMDGYPHDTTTIDVDSNPQGEENIINTVELANGVVPIPVDTNGAHLRIETYKITGENTLIYLDTTSNMNGTHYGVGKHWLTPAYPYNTNGPCGVILHKHNTSFYYIIYEGGTIQHYQLDTGLLPGTNIYMWWDTDRIRSLPDMLDDCKGDIYYGGTQPSDFGGPAYSFDYTYRGGTPPFTQHQSAGIVKFLSHNPLAGSTTTPLKVGPLEYGFYNQRFYELATHTFDDISSGIPFHHAMVNLSYRDPDNRFGIKLKTVVIGYRYYLQNVIFGVETYNEIGYDLRTRQLYEVATKITPIHDISIQVPFSVPTTHRLLMIAGGSGGVVYFAMMSAEAGNNIAYAKSPADTASFIGKFTVNEDGTLSNGRADSVTIPTISSKKMDIRGVIQRRTPGINFFTRYKDLAPGTGRILYYK